MFIEIDETPNPATLKFLPGRPVLSQEAGLASADFRDAAAAAERSPLAGRLFDLPGVDGVFLGADFVSVTKAAAIEWFSLKPLIMGAIIDHFASGLPVVHPPAEGATAAAAGDDDEIVVQIKELLDTRVRPQVAMDGGDIVFERWDAEEGVVYLHLQGSCAGCPSSLMTLKRGIEHLLMHYVPEVNEVRAVNQ